MVPSLPKSLSLALSYGHTHNIDLTVVTHRICPIVHHLVPNIQLRFGTQKIPVEWINPLISWNRAAQALKNTIPQACSLPSPLPGPILLSLLANTVLQAAGRAVDAAQNSGLWGEGSAWKDTQEDEMLPPCVVHLFRRGKAL